MFSDQKIQALDRLKKLENDYSGFGINYDPAESPSLKQEQGQDVNKSRTLDPKGPNNSVDESQLETDRANASIDSSPASESLEEEDVHLTKSTTEEIGGSFLERLSQKYGKGQANLSNRNSVVGRENSYPGSGYHRKSFMNRVKKSDNVPYLEELSGKFGTATHENESEENFGIGIRVNNEQLTSLPSKDKENHGHTILQSQDPTRQYKATTEESSHGHPKAKDVQQDSASLLTTTENISDDEDEGEIIESVSAAGAVQSSSKPRLAKANVHDSKDSASDDLSPSDEHQDTVSPTVSPVPPPPPPPPIPPLFAKASFASNLIFQASRACPTPSSSSSSTTSCATFKDSGVF